MFSLDALWIFLRFVRLLLCALIGLWVSRHSFNKDMKLPELKIAHYRSLSLFCQHLKIKIHSVNRL